MLNDFFSETKLDSVYNTKCFLAQKLQHAPVFSPLDHVCIVSIDLTLKIYFSSHTGPCDDAKIH